MNGYNFKEGKMDWEQLPDFCGLIEEAWAEKEKKISSCFGVDFESKWSH